MKDGSRPWAEKNAYYDTDSVGARVWRQLSQPAAIGGQTSALPSGMSISRLNDILESLNVNFLEGTTNRGLLGCPR